MATMAQESPHRRAPTHGIRSVARQLRHNKGALGGLLVLLLLSLVALSAPLLAPYDPLKVQARKALRPPSAEFFLGTDQYGLDVLSRTIYGTHISLLVGCISVSIAAVSGLLIGLVAGYYGGFLGDPEVRVLPIIEAGGLAVFHVVLVAERLQGLDIEAL